MKDEVPHSIETDEMIPGNYYFTASHSTNLEYVFKFASRFDERSVYYTSLVSNEGHLVMPQENDIKVVRRRAQVARNGKWTREASYEEKQWLETCVMYNRYMSKDETQVGTSGARIVFAKDLYAALDGDDLSESKGKRKFKIAYINNDDDRVTIEAEGLTPEDATSTIKDIKTKLYHIEN